MILWTKKVNPFYILKSLFGIWQSVMISITAHNIKYQNMIMFWSEDIFHPVHCFFRCAFSFSFPGFRIIQLCVERNSMPEPNYFLLQRHAHKIVSSTLFICWSFPLAADPRLLRYLFMTFKALVPRLNIFVSWSFSFFHNSAISIAAICRISV